MEAADPVRTTFNYTRDTGIQLEIYFCEPPAGTRMHSHGDDPREMAVHDGWPRAREFSPDREGSALRDFPSSSVWEDDSAIKSGSTNERGAIPICPAIRVEAAFCVNRLRKADSAISAMEYSPSRRGPSR